MCWGGCLFLKGDMRLDSLCFYQIINGLAKCPFECVHIEAYKDTRRNDQIWFQRLPLACDGAAQKKILHLENWSQFIHLGPASILTKFFCVDADSLLIRAATTSTSGTLNDGPDHGKQQKEEITI